MDLLLLLLLISGLQAEGPCNTTESVRLVGGVSRCAGTLELRRDGQWRAVGDPHWTLTKVSAACEELDCGSAVSVSWNLKSLEQSVWVLNPACVQNGFALTECVTAGFSSSIAHVNCSGEHLTGNEPAACSIMLHHSDSRFSPESVRLVGGVSRCAGTLELRRDGQWRAVGDPHWTIAKVSVACQQLDCGSAVSVAWNLKSSEQSVWVLNPSCVQNGTALMECVTAGSSSSIVHVNCSDSVRLVNGISLCSGRLEVKSDQSNQSWSSVCEADFDQQDAEVVCRELGCGAPSVLQGALYGEVEAPMLTKEFQCGGNESALLDCRSSGSDRNTCSPRRAVGLTCSEPVRLVGGASRCAGVLEVSQRGDWRPVVYFDVEMSDASVLCRQLECGSALSAGERKNLVIRTMWWISSDCIQAGAVLRECLAPWPFERSLELTCSNLFQPIICVSSSVGGASEEEEFQVSRGSSFTISCSIQPQYPGGSFQLSFTSSTSAHNYTQPAVNHSAHFLFPAAEPAYQGSYSCVYHVHVFPHNFSSESRQLTVSVSDPTVFIIRALVLPLTVLLANSALYCYCKATRGQRPSRRGHMELDY
ncbi:scavenger receptor cysteine-rich type 1 protein M130-like [Centropristis striata]|uniref:scavenger receptor cysteine-rich type 1 protein M130-like n=1 Tax=Centropristis striata TaxID=184440 RepID=UPI0027E00E0C|nr:scavenger receptor cysteine-rich type 1 protein M130-like [Centropristis striata]